MLESRVVASERQVSLGENGDPMHNPNFFDSGLMSAYAVCLACMQNQELRGKVGFMAEEVRQHASGMQSVQQQLSEAGQRNHDLREQMARLVDDIGRSGAERAGHSQQQVRPSGF